ncbi:MAG TPA: hypothetical protein VNN17_13550, partial [Terriglobia bacterium]|nr:hypothetical protein [Terriglobia bacterium]
MSGPLRWYLLLTVAVALFFWKILFTSQFSLVLSREGANQTYAWYSFAARSIQQGRLPLWDPYTLSGHSYIGESQTGLFYPLKLPLYLWPFDSEGYLSERVLHQMYILAHLLAAFFLFLCARELGIANEFAAFVAAVCFSLGGFTGRLGWPYMMDSALWLPLLFFLLLRALRSPTVSRRLGYACGAGLALGLALLAGSIHVPFMDVLAVVSAAGFFACRTDAALPARVSPRQRVAAAVAVVLLIGAVSFAAGAVQLLPSLEYAERARRWTTEWSGPFAERIPYFVSGGFVHQAPRAVLGFLFGGVYPGDAEYGPYFGIFPLVLTVIGVWRNWAAPWVKYLAGLATLSFLLSLGDYSLLHGLAYSLIPYFDKLWEAGRFIYLTHFAMALLAGFGMQSLLADDTAGSLFYRRINRVLGWTVAILLPALGLPLLIEKPAVEEQAYLTLVVLLACWAAYSYLQRGHRHGLARFAVVAVILADLYAFNDTFKNQMVEEAANADHILELRSLREVARYLRSQPGLFRMDFDPDATAHGMGDIYEIQTTHGAGVSMLADYFNSLWTPNTACLLNVRYTLGKGADRSEAPVFTSGEWKIYENPSPCPRAWVVHETVVEPPEAILRRLREAPLDLLRVAYLSQPLPQP